MNTPSVWNRLAVLAGLIAMLIGAIDPLEGCVVILVGVALAALGAGITKSRHRVLLYWAVTLVAMGVAAMIALTWLGGVGGHSGRSMWWLLVCVPYPIGWLLGLVGSGLTLAEMAKCCALRRRAVP